MARPDYPAELRHRELKMRRMDKERRMNEEKDSYEPLTHLPNERRLRHDDLSPHPYPLGLLFLHMHASGATYCKLLIRGPASPIVHHGQLPLFVPQQV